MAKRYTMVQAYFLLGFLLILNILNFADRYILANLGPLIIEDLGFSNTQLGLLIGFYFVALYTIFGLFMGTLADRFNRPRLIAGGLFLWSLLTALSGASRNFMQLGAARLFIGIGEAALTPAAMSMLSDTFPKRLRAFASGTYYMGIPLGIGASLVVAGTLGSYIGWRACFYALGIAGILMCGVMVFLRDPPRGAGDDFGGDHTPQELEHNSLGAIVSEIVTVLRRSPSLILTIIGSSVIVFAIQATTFDQVWLVAERGFEQDEAAQIFGFIFMVFGTIGVFIGGVLSDMFHRWRENGRIIFLVIMQVALLPFALAFRFAESGSVFFYFCGVIGAMAITMQYGPAFASVQDLVPPGVRSTIVAVLIFGHNFFGVGPGAFLTGYLADTFEAWGWDDPVTWSTFIIGATGVLAIPCFAVAALRFQHDLRAAEKVVEEELAG